MDTVEKIVAETIAEVLGATPLDKDSPLVELGMDSIDAIDLFYTLEDKFDLPKFGDMDNVRQTVTQRMIEVMVKERLSASHALS